MPTYIRPKRAIIEPGGDRTLLAALGIGALILGGGTALASLITWVADHAVLLITCASVFVLVLGRFCVWCAWATSPARRELRRQAERWRERAEAAPPPRDIPAAQPPTPERATWPQLEPGYGETFGSAHKKEA
jgi:hypothetical protein